MALSTFCFGLLEDEVRVPNLPTTGKRPTGRDDVLEMGNL